MVTLAEALEEAVQAAPRPQKVEAFLLTLSPKDAAALEAAMLGDLPSRRISDVLKAHGHEIHRGAIDGWRSRNKARR